MTISNLYEMIQDLKEFFDIVRLVDIDHMDVCTLDENGVITREAYKCYSIWKKQEICENCTSAKACYMNNRQEKYELIDGQIYHVISKCVTVDETHYALEAITKSSDETLLEAYGKGQLVNAISKLNEKIYEDSLTGLKNRRYYEEHRYILDKSEAMALMDIDNFKQINDTYGHHYGDLVLKCVSKTILKTVRESDKVIRIGGDEIYIAFSKMDKEHFRKRLEEIRKNVLKIHFSEMPDIKISISIGGYYKDENNCENPLTLTDKQMYKAKQKKNHIVI